MTEPIINCDRLEYTNSCDISDRKSQTATRSTEDIYYTRDGNSYLIENNLQCSNKNCLGNTMPNFNPKNRQRLYAAATQMQEDVKRHILKDSPHGEQVKHFLNKCLCRIIDGKFMCIRILYTIIYISFCHVASGTHQYLSK